MSVKRVEVVERSWIDTVFLPLLSCESRMLVKENQDRKKKIREIKCNSRIYLSIFNLFIFKFFKVPYSPYVIKSNVSLSFISLIKDRHFKVGVPPFASNKASKETSEPLPNIALWWSIFSELHSIVLVC